MVSAETTITEADFRRMCEEHDLTYQYSDDSHNWNRGREQRVSIEIAARHLPDGVAKRIWNEVVDTKVLEGHREQFYWKG